MAKVARKKAPVKKAAKKYVVLRSAHSGVWFGVEVKRTPAGQFLTIDLVEARRIWRWQGATECAGISQLGCKSDKMTVPATVTVAGVCEVNKCSAAAVAVLKAVPTWNP